MHRSDVEAIFGVSAGKYDWAESQDQMWCELDVLPDPAFRSGGSHDRLIDLSVPAIKPPRAG